MIENIEIVKFRDGTYGVRKQTGFLLWNHYQFLSANGTGNWHPESYCRTWCRFPSESAAETAIKIYQLVDDESKPDFGEPVTVCDGPDPDEVY